MKIFDRLFSDKYVNRAAVADNVLLLVMYRFAYPFAYQLSRLNLSPNQITTLSLASSILAFIALVYDENYGWFGVFWGTAVLLDFCDGTVARMTNKVSKSAFRYDHMSDIFKISLLLLGVGIHFDHLAYWILSTIFIFTYTYSEILSHDLKSIGLQKAQSDLQALPVVNVDKKRLRERFLLIRYVTKKFPLAISFARQIYIALTTFNGHTLLVFFVLPVGGGVTMTALVYLILLTVVSSITDVKLLWKMNR